MNKIISIIAIAIILLGSTEVSAQLVKSAPKNAPKGWQNMSYDTDKVYGAEIDRAYGIITRKPIDVTIAIIGTGVDIEHGALANSLWVNPKEKANGKDNDKNGYIGDIHGWNFLGNAKGEILDTISTQGVREFIRLKDKYAHIFPSELYMPEGFKLYVFDEAKNELVEVTDVDRDEYIYFRRTILPESKFGNAYVNIKMKPLSRKSLMDIEAKVRAAYPDEEEYNKFDANNIQQFLDSELDKKLGSGPSNLYRASLVGMIAAPQATKTRNWKFNYNYIIKQQLDYLDAFYNKMVSGTVFNERKLVGDDYLNIKDTKYGNNILITHNAGIGTALAGVVAGKTTDENNFKGVAENAKIMTLRVEADPSGDPYLKDIALAIRYAVDNGAKVILLPLQNTINAAIEMQWVNEALIYAEQKGVLLVQPMSEWAVNLDENTWYPNKNVSDTHVLSNLITVAASDMNGNPYTMCNFGKKTLDLFAPGVSIYAPYIGNTYRYVSTSRIAGAMVCGVAAMLKGEYPNLTPAQIRALIMDNVTSRKGAEIEKSVSTMKDGKVASAVKDLYEFDDMCSTAGILNAYKALEAAQKMK